MHWGFIFVAACLVVVSGDPNISSVAATSAAPTDAAVASSTLRDAGAPPVQEVKTESEGSKESMNDEPPPNAVVDQKKTDSSGENAVVTPSPAAALEVGDMMKDPYHHANHSSSDKEGEINNETVTVNDPHVNPRNITHEEEGAGRKVDDASTENSTAQALEASTTERPTPSASTVESTTAKVQEEDKAAQKPESEGDVSEEKSEKPRAAIDQDPTAPVSALVAQHDSHDHPVVNKASSLNHTTQAAAILAGALVAIALLGYAGLLMWRRVLEKRYGNREMLVNEDDDFKHFEL